MNTTTTTNQACFSCENEMMTSFNDKLYEIALFAIDRDDIELLQVLLIKSLDVNTRDLSLLRYAVEKSRIEIVQYLCRKIDKELLNDNKILLKILFSAIQAQCVECVQELYSAGVHTDSIDCRQFVKNLDSYITDGVLSNVNLDVKNVIIENHSEREG